jgi:hypothetical protein
MKAFFMLFVSLSLFTSFSCKKDDLPKATQTGANIIAAKVNGKVWEKKACWSCIGGGTGLRVNYDDRNFFGISGEQKDENKDIVITLVIPNLKSIGAYPLSGEGKNQGFLSNYSNGSIKYATSGNNNGTITITKLDLANKIISGTFEFTAEDENNPANTIKVTDGRFDVTFL